MKLNIRTLMQKKPMLKKLIEKKSVIGSKLKKLKNAGFTLAEMVIVVAIFALVSSIALFDQAKLTSSTLLTNMAYEIALAVREAQLYGISVRSESSGNFQSSSGVYINIANPRQVVVFSNAADGTEGFDPSAGEERVQYVFENQRTNRIRTLCVGDLESGSATIPCTSGSPEEASELNIVFKRPNPAPKVYAKLGPSGDMVEYLGKRVYVVIDTGDGQNCKVVVVEPTGQTRIVDQSSGLCSNS